MLRDFLCFLRAMWSEWKVLLTGGTVIAVLAVWTFSGRALPKNTNWFVLALTLLLAAFFAWRREWVAGNRGFVDVTPRQLKQLYQDRTSVQAAAMIGPYIGKTIKTTAILYDTSTVFPLIMFAHLRDSEDFGSVSINFFVPFWQKKVFAALPRGALLTIAGRIEEVDTLSLRLKSVMLIKIAEPSEQK